MSMRIHWMLTIIVVVGLRSTIVMAQGYPPDEAAKRMGVAEGLTAHPFASEPMIRQPVAIEFDDRGRLWVIQYLQYPNPAGLKRVEVDRYSRTVYDRMPEPPPRGPKGADRITILEDTDGDGRADRAKDFVSGLNLASSLAFGHGGVYVLQAPYLLFYPDRDRDDVPDGDPEVLLTGFGMNDAHSVANSLTWGPDGWLYGLQGSTVTARIRGIEFQQGVWRYHPITRRFELFAEGGGNMWGLDFDRHGRLFASTNVGGSVMLHMVQGGYYWKSLGKHGPLHNPYTFGYFEHVPHENIKGGHVAVGGLFYLADAFPDTLRGKYLAADLLDHSAHWHEIFPRGSTVSARQGGDLFRANDTWFAPSDMTLGPDGSVYVSDWHDKRTAHPDPDADWDRSNGRIYALDGPGSRPVGALDLAAKSSRELIHFLTHSNIWYVRKARRILSERRDPAVIPELRERVLRGRGQEATEALWALYGCGGFDDATALAIGNHPDEDIRVWTVRLLGDEGKVSEDLAAMLIALAANDPSVAVRSQLASTASRLPVDVGLEIVRAILDRDEDRVDPHVPLLLWWAIERHAMNNIEGTLARFATREAWKSELTRTAILDRLMSRFAAASTTEGDTACARLLASAPDASERVRLCKALDDATRDRRSRKFGEVLVRAVHAQSVMGPQNVTLTRLDARFGDRAARDRALATALDIEAPVSTRLALIDLVAELGEPSSWKPLLTLATGDDTDAIQASALNALGRFENDAIAPSLLSAYAGKGASWRGRVRDVLLGRRATASILLDAIERGTIAVSEIPLDQVAKVALLGDAGLDARVRTLWGRVAAATPEEKLAEVRRLNNDLRAASGDRTQGRLLFQKHCATCHRLFDDGNQVGPELTHANRGDRDFLLVSLVDPSRVIRKEYQATVVQTKDGRLLNGLLAEQTPDRITLVGPNGERTSLARQEIEEMADSTTSLMPENLYREFTPDQLRDLFAYLQGDGPVEAPDVKRNGSK